MHPQLSHIIINIATDSAGSSSVDDLPDFSPMSLASGVHGAIRELVKCGPRFVPQHPSTHDIYQLHPASCLVDSTAPAARPEALPATGLPPRPAAPARPSAGQPGRAAPPDTDNRDATQNAQQNPPPDATLAATAAGKRLQQLRAALGGPGPAPPAALQPPAAQSNRGAATSIASADCRFTTVPPLKPASRGRGRGRSRK